MRRLVLAVVLLVTAACSQGGGGDDPAPDGASPGGKDDATSTPSTALADEVGFAVRCDVSHRAPDDPIVHFGHDGASHDHTFFGNVSTDAGSTAASLLAAATTCAVDGDRSAYWAPTLIDGDRPVEATHVDAYYLTGGKDPATIGPFPTGLAMVSGDAFATREQSPTVVTWGCGDRSGRAESRTVPACPEGSTLHLRVRFPDCWDGEHLDSPSHRTHVAWPAGAGCPTSHPVSLPRLVLDVVYPIEGGRNVSLTSGSALTGHADVLAAWEPEVLTELVETCLRAGRVCGRVRGSDLPLPPSPS
ncbi:MAG: DUF1996 domain-containing protein [Acidimicrobiia bacterium]|nr:DUF1996 domain-containing protein [Acidimicrobiia bacterium]